MKAFVKYVYLKEGSENKFPVAVIKVDPSDPNTHVKPGGLTYNNKDILIEVNQSLCVWAEWKVLGAINQGLPVKDGEEITLVWDCKAEENCGYPFCGKACPGNKKKFRIQEYEKRNY